MPDISKRELKKFMVAVVFSGTVEATDVSEARKKVEYALELFDFIDGLQLTMRIREL